MKFVKMRKIDTTSLSRMLHNALGPFLGFEQSTDEWVQRGQWQIDFLRHNGLEPHHIVLDVGCGPLRGGIHLIQYLDKSCYTGFDGNSKHILIAIKMIISTDKLFTKYPIVICEKVSNFKDKVTKKFDFGMVFSVLNHCTDTDHAAFFRQIIHLFNPGGKLFISHSRWFNNTCIDLQKFNVKMHHDPVIHPNNYGWKENEQSILPIVEIERKTGQWIP